MMCNWGIKLELLGAPNFRCRPSCYKATASAMAMAPWKDNMGKIYLAPLDKQPADCTEVWINCGFVQQNAQWFLKEVDG